MYTKELAEAGVLIYRIKSASGMKPHLCVRFRDEDGIIRDFAVDTSRTPGKVQPDAYLITHAHSDHFGRSTMNSEKAWCSYETAKALEIRYEKEFCGNRFVTGSTVSIEGTRVRTIPVYHTPGSCAFMWENDVGTKILVTGDVKCADDLPKCDVLITEASYGDPDDPSCHFSEDTRLFEAVVSENAGRRKIAFGAYDFGKAQKAVSLLREIGYDGPIFMSEKTAELTKCFVENCGDLETVSLTDRRKKDGEDLLIVPPPSLSYLPSSYRRFVLTCRRDYPYPNIRMSDHLDADGLSLMVDDCDPELTIVYHPNKGSRPDRFAAHLRQKGHEAMSLSQIRNIFNVHDAGK